MRFLVFAFLAMFTIHADSSQEKMEITLIETPRLKIRECSEEDMDALQVILGDPDVMKYSLKGPLNRGEVEQYYKKMMLNSYEKYGYGLWGLVHKENHQLIGIAGIFTHENDPFSGIEMCIRLSKNYWRKGFAMEAMLAIKDYAFTILDLDSLVASIDSRNESAINGAKKFGMSWIKTITFRGSDVDIYGINRNDQPIIE